MLNINIIDDNLLIKNINKNSIKNIYSIYKNTIDFKYATGVFYSIDYDQFSYQFSQFILKPNGFYLDICLASSNEIIGLIKGSVIEKDNAVWINSFVINTPYQSNGYGKKVIKALEDYFHREYDIQRIYLSVYKSNNSGLKFWLKCGYKECNYLLKNNLNKSNEFVQLMWKIL